MPLACAPKSRAMRSERRNGGQDWLVVSAADHLNLLALCQRRDALQKSWMRFSHPIEQRAGIMQR